MKTLNKKKIDESYKRIKSIISKTPLVTNETVNRIANANVFFKLENLQYTGSFKLRGASNKISKLSEEDKSKGIVAYSSGNHAQAVSYASKLYKISNTIVMPKNAPKNKIENTKKYGSKIILYNNLFESREKIALNIASKENKIVIKPYDDLDIIAGQGTVGKEIAEQLLEYKIKPDIYLCCCGGGGLIAGSSTYIKNIFPKIKIYSVEPKHFNDTELSLKNKKIIYNKKNSNSICDALLAPRPGKITFPINKKLITKGISVTDQQVKEAIIFLAENLKIVVEPGGAVATAALLSKKIKFNKKNVIIMISGGNIDYSLFSLIARNKK